MGTVYRAKQKRLNRTVALKMIRSHRLASSSDRERFRIEVEASATLSHPNIVRIYATGEHEGQPYFSMEWMASGDMRDALRSWKASPIPVERAVSWMIMISEAVHHAHERGVLHRDLTPRNVLFDEHGVPKVCDFGLARFLNNPSELTQTGQGMGSPGYASPEQASGSQQEPHPTSDVFSLGAILYHLITGRAPFSTQHWNQFLRQVAEDEPAWPSVLNPAVDRELGTICLQCLNKDPGQRYPSARALAEDLSRWQRGEPITAHPLPLWRRAAKWTRRKPMVATLTAALALVIVVGSITATWFAVANARQRAQHDLAESLRVAGVDFRNHNNASAFSALARVLRKDPGNRVAAERLVNTLRQRVFLVSVDARAGGVSVPEGSADLTTPIQQSGTRALSPDGQWELIRTAPTVVELRTSQGKPLWSRRAHEKVIRSWGWSPDGRWVVTAAADGKARLWDVSTGGLVQEVDSGESLLYSELNPLADSWVTAASSGVVRLWDRSTGRSMGAKIQLNGAANHAHFSPDGRFVVTSSDDGVAQVWHAGRDGTLAGAAFSEAARFRLPVNDAVFTTNLASIWVTLSNGERRHCWMTSSAWSTPLGGPAGFIEAAGRVPSVDIPEWLARQTTQRRLTAVSPDRRHAATLSGEGPVLVWDLRSRQTSPVRLLNEANVIALCFSPDGLRIATGDADRRVIVWDADTGVALGDPARSAYVPTQVWFTTVGLEVQAQGGLRWALYDGARERHSWLASMADLVAGDQVPTSAAGSDSRSAQDLANLLAAIRREKERLGPSSPSWGTLGWAEEYIPAK
ncbi:MAG: protein kinase [Verrucomicrobia bacterium]|nr:protein kinase [Verrucomicrobiota bacterium]MBI3868722.1 protein kinase [Verrucomicrobiota bacterium]